MPAMSHLIRGIVCSPEEVIQRVTPSPQSPMVESHTAPGFPWDRPNAQNKMHLQKKGHPTTPLKHKLTEHLIKTCISKLPNNTAPGEDGIPNEIIKHLPHEIYALVLRFFQLLWEFDVMPPELNNSTTLLFLKKQPLTDNGNYRPMLSMHPCSNSGLDASHACSKHMLKNTAY